MHRFITPITRRLAWLAGVSAILGISVSGALGACGGDNATGIPGSPDATPDGSSGTSGTSGSGGTSGSPGPDDAGGGTPDAGEDAALGEEPGRVACGATTCDLDQNQCCRTATDAGCQSGGCPGIRLDCDEAADCRDNERCCLAFGQGGDPGRARCDDRCGVRPQLCRTHAECGDGGACGRYTCPGIGVVHTCTAPPGCN